MTLPSPWMNTVDVVLHNYFRNKEQFERESDVYQVWACFAVEKGEFRYEIGGTSGLARMGSLVICPPGVRFHRITDDPITFHFFLFAWTGQDGNSLPSGAPVHLGFNALERFYSSLSLLRSVSHYRHVNGFAWHSHLLNDLFRLYDLEQSAPAIIGIEPSDDPLMAEAKRTLDAAFDQSLTIQSLAYQFGLSPVQFSRRFHKAFGLQPSEYLSRLRLQKICYFLTHTSNTIEQIAEQCGFSNGFYLSRVFAAKMKLTPSEFRRMHRV